MSSKLDNACPFIHVPVGLSLLRSSNVGVGLRVSLFCSLAVLDPRVDHTTDVLATLSLFSVILIDSSTESPFHVLMLSIQAVRGLPRLRAPGIVPCIIFLQATPLVLHCVTIACWFPCVSPYSVRMRRRCQFPHRVTDISINHHQSPLHLRISDNSS